MTTPRVRLRGTLDGVPAYVPGRPAGPGPDGSPAFKISSNENPYPPLPSVLEVVRRAAEQMNRYPDMAASALVEAIAAHAGVTADEVAVGTGSVGVLSQILAATCGEGDEVVYAWRSFEAYPILVQLSGATAVPVPLGPGGRHDLAAMAAAVTDRTRLVLVCTPNNPTGPGRARRGAGARSSTPCRRTCWSSSTRPTSSSSATRRRRTPSPLRRARPNVAVLRTFSKAYGLAGLRIGLRRRRPRGRRRPAQDRRAVRGLDRRPGRGDRLPRGVRRAGRAGRRPRRAAGPGDRGAAGPGLGHPGQPGQLRLAGAGRAHDGVRRRRRRPPGSSSGPSPAPGPAARSPSRRPRIG